MKEAGDAAKDQSHMNTTLRIQALGWQAIITVAAFLILSAPVFSQGARKDKTAEDSKDAVTSLQIIVTGGPQNKPVDNASVYLHWGEHRFLRHEKQMEFDLKTDMKGVAIVKDVPRIRILIQVVKDGWKPFGRYYNLDKPEQKIEIKLEPPPHWY
ncbi:MAG TPA: hypothetical protein VKS20_13025 [Candidatus Acidoferrales bacterium]|nr:hypothetical protein [Candidatus Acidoferrales bacterium]